MHVLVMLIQEKTSLHFERNMAIRAALAFRKTPEKEKPQEFARLTKLRREFAATHGDLRQLNRRFSQSGGRSAAGCSPTGGLIKSVPDPARHSERLKNPFSGCSV